MAEPGGFNVGARVTLRQEAFDTARAHIRAHALRGEVGTVVLADRPAWAGWINVHFESCRIAHRLTADEISLAR